MGISKKDEMHGGCIFDNRNARRANDEYSSDVTVLTYSRNDHTALIVVNTVDRTIELIPMWVQTVYQTKYNIIGARFNRPLH